MKRNAFLILLVCVSSSLCSQEPAKANSQKNQSCVIVRCGSWFSNDKCQRWYRQIEDEAVTKRPAPTPFSRGKFKQVEALNFDRGKKEYTVEVWRC